MTTSRRPTIAVATSVVVLALIAGVVVLLTGGGTHGPALAAHRSAASAPTPVIVPWSAAGVRADTTYVPLAVPVGVPRGMRSCSDADFTLVSSSTGLIPDGSGWLTTSFLLRAVGRTPCAVPNGGVDVALLDRRRVALPTEVFPLNGPMRFPQEFLVRPGQFVGGSAVWAVYRGRASRPARLVINPSGDQAARYTSRLTISLRGITIPPHPRNPFNESPWRALAYGGLGAGEDPGSLETLNPTMTAPSRVENGAILRYTVTLANPTPVAVSLARCPDFAERLDVIPIKWPTTVGFRGMLNCAAAPEAIGPGAAVTFDFQLRTAGEIPGPGNLTWQLVASGSAIVTTTARVTVSRSS